MNKKRVDKLEHAVATLDKDLAFIRVAEIYPYTRRLDSFISYDETLKIYEGVLEELKTQIIEFQLAMQLTAIGKMSAHFVPPNKLREILIKIGNNLPLDLNLLARGDDNYLYYEAAESHCALYNGKIRIFVQLPLQSPQRTFELYEIQSLPYSENLSPFFIQVVPSHKYIAVTRDLSQYIEYTDADLRKCKRNVLTICPPLKPIRYANEDSCLYALFRGYENITRNLCKKNIIKSFPPILVRTQQTNSWVYSVDKEVTVHSRCGGSNVISWQGVLTGSGTIEINSDCYLIGEKFVILPHYSGFSRLNDNGIKVHVPKLKNILHEKESNLIYNISKKDEELIENILTDEKPDREFGISIEKLKAKLDAIKYGNDNFSIKNNNNNHSMILLMALAAGLTIIIQIVAYFLFKKFKSLKLSGSYNVNDKNRENIKLTETCLAQDEDEQEVLMPPSPGRSEKN
jgi:hypothetical protein